MEFEYLKELEGIINTFLNLAETLLKYEIIDREMYINITIKKKGFLKLAHKITR